jgi:hypothetical protein
MTHIVYLDPDINITQENNELSKFFIVRQQELFNIMRESIIKDWYDYINLGNGNIIYEYINISKEKSDDSILEFNVKIKFRDGK